MMLELDVDLKIDEYLDKVFAAAGVPSSNAELASCFDRAFGIAVAPSGFTVNPILAEISARLHASTSEARATMKAGILGTVQTLQGGVVDDDRAIDEAIERLGDPETVGSRVRRSVGKAAGMFESYLIDALPSFPRPLSWPGFLMGLSLSLAFFIPRSDAVQCAYISFIALVALVCGYAQCSHGKSAADTADVGSMSHREGLIALLTMPAPGARFVHKANRNAMMAFIEAGMPQRRRRKVARAIFIGCVQIGLVIWSWPWGVGAGLTHHEVSRLIALFCALGMGHICARIRFPIDY